LLNHFAAAWVVARRDFCAVIFSKTFIFFLIGPLFPVFIGAMAGDDRRASFARSRTIRQVGVAMTAQHGDAPIAARDTVSLRRMAGWSFRNTWCWTGVQPGQIFDSRAVLASKG